MRLKQVLNIATLSILMAAPTLAAAQCCPGSGTGLELAAFGLGEAHPSAANFSLDPNWQVFGFERDGIAYYQINDTVGNVRAVVGNVGDQFWTLPAGDSADHVSLPGRRMALPVGAVRVVLFHNPEFSLVLYQKGEPLIWSVEPDTRGPN